MPIRDGVLSAAISRRYAYHYPGTSWPGGGSNTYIYAHAQVGAFVNLKNARIGDLVTLRLSTGRYVKYKVSAKYSIAWNDDRFLLPTKAFPPPPPPPAPRPTWRRPGWCWFCGPAY